jgi:rod shape-determining protein MreD
MRSEYFIPILIFFPVLVIQTTVVPLISVAGVLPDLILILLVFYSIRTGNIYGAILGFIFGLFYDLITGSLLGSAMLSKTLVGFIAGYFSNENKRDLYLHSYPFILIVLLCSLIDSIVYSFFSDTDLGRNILLLFFEQGMLPGLYTSIISLIVMIFMPKRRFG